jgi:hypothetical protein
MHDAWKLMRLSLWDEDGGKLVGFREIKGQARQAA